jgi:sulfur carrier protein ThiS
MSVSGSTDAQVKIDRARAKAESDAAKRAKELLALTKKQVKSQEALNKKKKEEGILGQIAQRFDLERVQIAAALGGQINDVERLRLELMQAILDEDVKRAIILEGQLIKAEAAAKELADLLDSLDEMVGDPFVDWPSKITRIQELLKQLNIKIPIETLFAEKGLRLDQSTMSVTKLERMDVNANNVYINGTNAAALGGTPSPNSVLDPAAAAAYVAGDPVITPAVEAHADALAALAASELALAELMLIESGGTPSVEIIVNVEGSVIAQEDLTATILDNLYRHQRAGQDLLLSSVAI